MAREARDAKTKETVTSVQMREKEKKPFSTLRCERVEYEFSASLEKFDLEKFISAASMLTGAPLEKGTYRLNSVANTHEVKHTDYHVHLSCNWAKGKFRTSLAYVEGVSKADPTDQGPFAEDVMQWFGQFFSAEEVSAEVSATFDYPRKKLGLLLPIPMRIPVIGRQADLPEVEAFGMALNLPSKPQGAREVYATSLPDAILLSVIADRNIEFHDFDLHRDLTALSSVARLFLEEHRV
jgi:hypothetical protein